MLMGFFMMTGFMKPEISVSYNDRIISFGNSKPFMYDEGQKSGVVASAQMLAAGVGASVYNDRATGALSVRKGADTLTFRLGKNTAIVNGRERAMPVSAFMKDDQFFIPVRFVGENLGKTVLWESGVSSVNIRDSLRNNFATGTDARNYISIDNFVLNSDTIYFNMKNLQNGLKEQYLPEENLNPQLNRQVFNISRILADHSTYLDLSYRRNDGENTADPYPLVSVSLSESKEQFLSDMMLFSFSFFEKTPANPKNEFKHKGFGNNAKIKLKLQNLHESADEGCDSVDQFFAYKLKLAHTLIFSENTGLKISEYLINEYKNIKKPEGNIRKGYKKTRKFDNVRVDLVYTQQKDAPGVMNVYYSY